MAATIVSNSTAATFGNSPQKTGEPLDHAKLYSGKALEFDGVSDYLDCDFPISGWTETTAITFSMWVNIGAGPGGSAYQYITTGRSTTHRVGLFLYSTDKLYLHTFDGSAFDGEYIAQSYVENTGWTYIVATIDGSGTKKIYINGVNISSTNDTGSLTLNAVADNLKIGALSTGHLDGKISNFQIWNAAWDADDIKYAYENPEKLITENASVSGSQTTSNLKLWYPMNDTGVRSPQTVIFDAAGTNNTTKNHATTTFIGDGLISGDNSTFTDGIGDWDVYDTWAGTFDHTTNDDKGTGTHAGGVANMAVSVSFTTVVGRTYTFAADFIQADGNIYIRVGESQLGTQNIGSTSILLSGADGSEDIGDHTWVATATTTHITIHHTTEAVWQIDNFQVYEVGIASGWTEAHQVETIPQTALMNGSSKQTFDGISDYINCSTGLGTSLGNNYAGSLSVSLWFKATETNVDDGLFDLGPFDGNSAPFYILLYSNNLYFKLNPTYPTINAVDAWQIVHSFTDTGWNNIVCVYDTSGSANSKMYLNGESVGTINNSGNFPADSDMDLSGKKTNIGAYWSATYKFNGIIDETSIWNTALSLAEVQELYNSGTPLDATEHSASPSTGTDYLVGYYRNNVLTTAGTWEDLSTNNNHGTIVGTPDTIFFQEGITSGKDSQGVTTNITHPSGGAVYFGGVSDYIDLGKTIIIEGEFTLEMWIKTDDFTGNMFCGLNADNYQSINTSTKFRMKLDGTQKSIDINDVGDHATDTLLVNEWFHFALTRNSADSLTIYVNGAPQGDDIELNVTDKFQVRYFGTDDASTNFFKGWLDEVRLYHKGLSAAQVTKNYKHGKSKHSN